MMKAARSNLSLGLNGLRLLSFSCAAILTDVGSDRMDFEALYQIYQPLVYSPIMLDNPQRLLN